MPSDTVYGLSARALDERAVERIYKLKKRNQKKPFIVLIANVSQLEQLGIDEQAIKPAKSYWPGALSVVCQAPAAPTWLQRGTNTLAIRLPAEPKLQALIKRVGPVVSTSANIQAGKVASSVKEAKAMFGRKLDFYVDGGDFSGRQPSTIAKVTGGRLIVLRPGALKV